MTPMQRDFCSHYARQPDAYKAMKAAGYSENYAKTKAKVMLNNEEIVTEINRIRQRMNERAEKSATDVVNEYSKIAFTDRVDFLKEDDLRPGEYIYKAPHELTDEQRSIVEKVTTTRREITTEEGRVWRQEYNYILSDKANALQQMGRHFGIFDDKLKLTAGQTNPFKNASPEQLAKLKESFVGIMAGGQVVDGQFKEVTHVLPNGKGRAGAGG